MGEEKEKEVWRVFSSFLPRAIWPMATTIVGSDEDRGGIDLWGKVRINSVLLVCRALYVNLSEIKLFPHFLTRQILHNNTNQLKVYKSVTFRTLTISFNHHFYQISKHFNYPKR